MEGEERPARQLQCQLRRLDSPDAARQCQPRQSGRRAVLLPLSPAIPLAPAAGYVVLVKDASSPVRATPGSVKTGALGGVLGLLLGLAAAVSWERSDRRTDDLDDLRAEVDCPAWEGALTPSIAVSILAHWQQSLPDEQIQIGIVRVGRWDCYAVAQLQQTIQQAARNHSVAFRNIDLSGGSVLEGLDTRTPIVVLCVAQGTPRSKLRDTVRRLGELGHSPDWAFLVASGTAADRSAASRGFEQPAVKLPGGDRAGFGAGACWRSISHERPWPRGAGQQRARAGER